MQGVRHREGLQLRSYISVLIITELVIQADGSTLGGGGAMQEIGGGWIVRRAEETAILL